MSSAASKDRRSDGGGRWAAAVVALGVLILIGAMSVTAIIRYDTVEDALKIWSAVTGVLGVVTGAVVAYFFTHGTVRQLVRVRRVFRE